MQRQIFNITKYFGIKSAIIYLLFKIVNKVFYTGQSIRDQSTPNNGDCRSILLSYQASGVGIEPTTF